MAKQTAIGYEASQEWADYQTGGTRIDAADLNHMEEGISDACNGVDELRTKRLPTYIVAQGGDTATQDVYQDTILGPCLILDLAERATYYDNGETGDAHERKLITSGADIDALQDSISRTVFKGQADSIGVGKWENNCQLEMLDAQSNGFIVSYSEDRIVVFRRTSGASEQLGSIPYTKA